MATPQRRGGIGGVSVSGIIVVIEIILLFITKWWIGLLVILIGLIAFGGFVRGRWH